MSTFTTSKLLTFAEYWGFYSSLCLLIFGSIGHCLIILIVLNLKIFRKNPCHFYLIVESVVNTIQLIICFLLQLLSKINNGNDPANHSLLWCKVRTVIFQPLSLLSFSIVCFAAYNQFLSTSHDYRLRQKSTYQFAQYSTLVSICFCLIHSIPFAIYLNIDSSSSQCILSNCILNRYYQWFYYPILTGILPISISFLLSLLAFRHVRQVIRHQISGARRQLDRQLTVMTLMRTMSFILLILPFAIHRIYWLYTSQFNENFFRTSIDVFFLTIIFSLFNLNFAISFYIFYISSSHFRHQMTWLLTKKCWRRCQRCWSCHQNQIVPLKTISIHTSAAT